MELAIDIIFADLRWNPVSQMDEHVQMEQVALVTLRGTQVMEFRYTQTAVWRSMKTTFLGHCSSSGAEDFEDAKRKAAIFFQSTFAPIIPFIRLENVVTRVAEEAYAAGQAGIEFNFDQMIRRESED